MKSIDAGWRQHFVSFAKAFLFFKECFEKPSYSPIEVGGLVHVFESTFELGWKTIKDFLFEQGLPAAFPRAAIKEGFSTGIIQDGHAWMEMLEKRNELSHTYNEQVAQYAVDTIKRIYFPAIFQVYSYVKNIHDNG